MKIVIFGADGIGSFLASQLYTNNDITIITNEKKCPEILNRLDVSFVDGSATDIEILNQANIKDADIFIACTKTDELNIVACLTAKRLCDVTTMCFVKNDCYKTSLGIAKDAEFNSEFYIDKIISPVDLLTQEIFQIITVAEALDVEDFARGKARLLEYKIADRSIFVNKAVKSCDFPKDTLIVGITRDDKLFIPNGDTVLQKNDRVIFMGLSESLYMLAGKFFHEKEFVKSVTIIGGGRVGLKLAKQLENLKLNIKIIEKDETRCNFLAQELNSTLVINGDGTDLELLTDEDISSSDVVVSTTDNDEKNLLTSLMVKQLGAKRVISRVSKHTNASLFIKVGIDVSISARMAILNEIKNSMYKTNIGILTTVEQGKGEVLTILLPNSFNAKKVMDLRLPSKAIIGIIKRRNRVIIPNGNTQLMAEDNIIVFTTSENADSIRKFFEGNR